MVKLELYGCDGNEAIAPLECGRMNTRQRERVADESASSSRNESSCIVNLSVDENLREHVVSVLKNCIDPSEGDSMPNECLVSVSARTRHKGWFKSFTHTLHRCRRTVTAISNYVPFRSACKPLCCSNDL